MEDIRRLYPGGPRVPESVRNVDAAVTPVAADVRNPAGDTIVNVGNVAEELVNAAPVSSDWASVTYEGATRLRYTNESVASNLRPGDELNVEIDGVTHDLTVYDVNPLTGEIYFIDNAVSSTDVTGGANVILTTVASEPSFTGELFGNLEGDVVDPNGVTVLDVGNSAHTLANPPAASAFQNASVDGEVRLRVTDADLAGRVKAGDFVEIDLDGVVTRIEVHSVDARTGIVNFVDDSTVPLTSIQAATTIGITTEAVEASFNGYSTRIARYEQTAVAGTGLDTPISTRIVHIQDTVYEDSSFTADTNTYYFIWKA